MKYIEVERTFICQLADVFDDTKLEDKLVAVVQPKIDTMLKQLEEM